MRHGDLFSTQIKSGDTVLLIDGVYHQNPSLRHKEILAAVRGVSLANNHIGDWGRAGIRATTTALNDAGVAHAGAGTSRYEAAAPGYLDFGTERLSLVSATATAPVSFQAQDAKSHVPPRAGVHVLRRVRTARVSGTDWRTIASLAESAEGPNRVYSDSVHFFGGRFTEDELLPTGQMLIDDSIAASDRQRFLSSIRLAAETAHVVVAAIHSHDPSNDAIDPPPYLIELAHAAAEAGADVVHIHGPHRARGIEVHAGTPIFYSLGTFIWNHTAQTEVPRDLFEKHHADEHMITGPELMAARQKAYFATDHFAIGLSATCGFTRGVLSKITIAPFALLGAEFGLDAGLPIDISSTSAAHALHSLAEMSTLFGTDVAIRDSTATINIGKDHT